MMAILGRLTGALLVLVALFAVARPDASKAQDVSTALPNGGACPDSSAAFDDPATAPHWNGWGVDAAQHRFQPVEMAELAAADVPRLKLKWAFGFPGANRAFAQPTVMGGRIFVGSQGGQLYSLDARSGCIYWTVDAGAPVRSAIVIGQGPSGWAAYFGDLGAQHRLGASVHAVDAMTGKALWTTRVEDHPASVITGSPIMAGNILFVPVSSWEELIGADSDYACCSFRGSVVALDAATGKLLWKHYTIAQDPKPGVTNARGIQLLGPSGAAVWSSPTFDARRRMVYVTTGDNYSDPPVDTSDAILALNADTGALVWSRQVTSGDAYNMACNLTAPQPNCPKAGGPDYDFGSSAILVDLANGQRVLIGAQKSGMVTAVDPDRQGALIWQKRVGQGGTLGGVQWGSASDGNRLFVAVSDVRLQRAAIGTPGSQISEFNPKMALLLDDTAGGGLYGLALKTGEAIWHTPHPGCNTVPGCSPAQSAAVTAMPGIVFSGGLDGHLRAYSDQDGSIVWDTETKAAYATVNGVAAHGGSIDGPGAVVVGGMLYFSSGSGLFGGIPGNVLLAYSVDGR